MTERARLTDALALAARPREREYAVHDAALQGFMLRVQPNGRGPGCSASGATARRAGSRPASRRR